jgi:hypothetical protein
VLQALGESYRIERPKEKYMTLTIPEFISIVVGIMSFLLAIISIWITFHFKKQTDDVNRDTKNLLVEVKSESKSITNGVLKELKQWGDTGRVAVSQMVENQTNNSIPTGFKPNLQETKGGDKK